MIVIVTITPPVNNRSVSRLDKCIILEAIYDLGIA